MTENKRTFQKIGAIFGLIAGLIIVIYLIVDWILHTPQSDLKPESLVQWTIDNQYLLFFHPLLIIALLFFGVLLHGINERFKKQSPPIASLSLHIGWMTILLKTLAMSALWFHVYLNSAIWNLEIAHQFSRLTYNAVTFFHVSSAPFLAGWLIVAGIGGIISNGFSKLFSLLSIVLGACVALEFLGGQWEAFFSFPLIYYLGYITPFAFAMLIWASIELLWRNEKEQRRRTTGKA